MTHGGRWTFLKKFSSLAHIVWEWRCPKDLKKMTCNTWHMTHGGRWTFFKKFSSLAHYWKPPTSSDEEDYLPVMKIIYLPVMRTTYLRLMETTSWQWWRRLPASDTVLPKRPTTSCWTQWQKYYIGPKKKLVFRFLYISGFSWNLN